MMLCLVGLNSELFGGTLQLKISVSRLLICYDESKYIEYNYVLSEILLTNNVLQIIRERLMDLMGQTKIMQQKF